jgi:hypothetical protein
MAEEIARNREEDEAVDPYTRDMRIMSPLTETKNCSRETVTVGSSIPNRQMRPKRSNF